MLTLISPAKTLDYDSPLPSENHTMPLFLEKSETLIDVCRKLTPVELSQLMRISDKLAALNVARFAQWNKEADFSTARQAIYAFQGDVYLGLEAHALSESEINYAQENLCILSGLYGVLRPLDLMRPYRLEMGTKLKTPFADNLYQYWRSTITQYLNSRIESDAISAMINLASDEYFSVVDTKALTVPVIKPIFQDEKNGKYKVISFFAKKARGMMARYLIQSKCENMDDIKAFNASGYQYCDKESTDLNWVFKRKEQ
ncbi:peroxide stress protein YaaA [Thorsellia anophelis]|nr:peroxide stress protein YaaA [Thorsellia anophelis]